MKVIKNIITIVLLLIPALTFATNVGDYQSSGNVTFKAKNNWQVYSGAKWVKASSAPTLESGTVTTVNDYAVIDGNIDVEGTLIINSTTNASNSPTISVGGNLIINSASGLYFTGNVSVLSGGTMTISGQFNHTSGTLNIAGSYIISSTGQNYCYGTTNILSGGTITNNNIFQSYSVMNITGTLQTSGTSFYLNGNNIVNSTGVVIFNQDGSTGSIPVATWNTGSTLNITGITSTRPQNLNQSFYNLTWNCSSQSADINLYDVLTVVNGNLTFSNTNNKDFTLFNWSSNTLTVGSNLVISGNTKVTLGGGGTSNIILTVGGNFIQSGGTLELGSSVNTMNVKGNFTSTGGKVTRTNGSAKINFNGTSTQYFTSSNTSESSNNVSIEVASGSSLVLASNMKVLGDTATKFRVYGSLDMSTYNIVNNFYFNLSGTGTLISGTGAISTYDATLAKFEISSGGIFFIGSSLGITNSGSTGNVQVNGTRTYVANAKYIYSGTSAQNTGNGLPTSISGLVISNSNGITLSNNVTVTDSLFMTTGDITTGSYTLTLSNTKPGSLSYTSGFVNGKFARAFLTSYITYSFPLDNSGSKRTVTINLSSTTASTGTITAQYISGDPSGILTSLTETNGYIVNTYSKDGLWQLDYSGSATITYSMNLVATGLSGVSAPSLLRVITRTNSSSAWNLSGTHVTGSSSPITAKRSGLTLASTTQFAIGGNSSDNPLDGALPVELVSFASSLSNNTDVKLTWVTSSEINNAGFEIQRKDNNSDYQKVGYVKGNNNTNSTSTYSFTDNSLATGKYTYRLKQIDNNGNYEYFVLNNTVEIGTPNKFSLSQNYPNPFNPITKINYAIATAGQVTVKVYDMTGREVKVLVNEVKSPGFYTVDFNGVNLASGIYVYRLTSNNFTDTKKLSLIK
jgi:hypothetical protein